MATAVTDHQTITLEAPAKVNLALSVGGVGSGASSTEAGAGPEPLPGVSRGRHPVASWLVAVDLTDTLTLRPAEASAGDSHCVLDIGVADDAPHSAAVAVDWPIEHDLAWRAHRLLAERLGRPLPIAATLEKRIPPAMGLAGGSSDAAAMLVGLDRLFDLGLSAQQLMAMGAELGSDVAFLVHVLTTGEAAGLASGVGERITPMSLIGPLHLALVLPGLACGTGAVYQAFDRLYPDAGPVAEQRVRALAEGGRVDLAGLFNDLAEPAFAVCPGLRSLRDQVAAVTGRAVHVTGSGAGLFLVADSQTEATNPVRDITEQLGVVSVAVSGIRGS